MMLNNVTDKDLKAEIKRREDAKKRSPLWVREPKWLRIANWLLDFILGCYITVLAPLWAPFWFASKIYRFEVKYNRERAKDEGLDWKRYHTNDV